MLNIAQREGWILRSPFCRRRFIDSSAQITIALTLRQLDVKTARRAAAALDLFNSEGTAQLETVEMVN